MTSPEAFRAYRLWVLLWHCEGRDASGLIRHDLALTRLKGLRAKEDWRRTVREAAKLTYTNDSGEVCGFCTIFKGKDGITRIRRHGLAAVCRFLNVEHVGLAVYHPITELLASVPKAKKALRLSYLQRPVKKRRLSLPKSLNTLASELHCNRTTIYRNLKAAGVELTRNTEIISAVDEEGQIQPQAFLSDMDAINFAKGLNQAWCNANGIEWTSNINPGPYSAQPLCKLSIDQFSDSPLWVIIRRLPNTISSGNVKTASRSYTLRLRAMLNSSHGFACEGKSHTRRDGAISVFAKTETDVYLMLDSTESIPIAP